MPGDSFDLIQRIDDPLIEPIHDPARLNELAARVRELADNTNNLIEAEGARKERIRIKEELNEIILRSLTHYVVWENGRSRGVPEPFVITAELLQELDRICPMEER